MISQCTVIRRGVFFCNAGFSSPRHSHQHLSVQNPHFCRHHDSPRHPVQAAQKLIRALTQRMKAAACASSTKSKPPSRPSSMLCSICLALIYKLLAASHLQEKQTSQMKGTGFGPCAAECVESFIGARKLILKS